ncbi:UBN2_2 domain-containing protein, partial [Cephalotus follicularis]
RFDFGGTSVTRLRSLVLKFEMDKKDPKNSMTEHLRIMSVMIRDLKNAEVALSDEQQVQAMIRSLHDSWVNMRQILTYNENTKNFADVSRRVELEAEREEAIRATALFPQGGKLHGNWSKRKNKGKSSTKEGSSNQGPRVGRVSKRHRGKRGGKKDKTKVKCYNFQKMGHFAHECTEPKQVSISTSSSIICVCSHVIVVHTFPMWIVDSGAIRHVTKDR